MAPSRGAAPPTDASSSTRPLVFKSFNLYRTAPHVPAPPGNYTPVPAPPFPPAGSYIEVPADTNCVKQGISPVPAEDCSRACQALVVAIL